MGIKVKPDFDKNIIIGAMSIAIERMKKRTIDNLIKAGQSFNRYAESNKGFQNQTFSLISSIGFVIADDGNIVHEEFIDGGNTEGRAKGLKVAKDNVPKQGVCLVGVAGEDYAIYVESRSKDVITGSAQYTTSLLKQVFKNGNR